MHSTKNLQKNSGRNFMFECIGANEREMVNARSFKPNRFKAGMTGSLALRRRNGQMEPDEKWLYSDLISKGHFSLKRLCFDRTHPQFLIEITPTF